MNAAFTITEPSKTIQDTLKVLEDVRGWKYPIKPVTCRTESFARELAAAMDFYYGGHELDARRDLDGGIVWVVSSKGYYHYVGA